MSNLKTKLLSLLLVIVLVITMVSITAFASDNEILKDGSEVEEMIENEVLRNTGGNATIIDGGTCGEELVWTYYSDGVLSISGEGEMDNYESYNSAPWYEYIKKHYSWDTTIASTKIVVNEGVTSIGSYAFSYCCCPVELPQSLTTLYPYAFYYAFDGLKNATIILPGGLATIGQNAFYGSSITSVDFPASLKTIGKNAFSYCRLLKTVELNSGLESIHEYVFQGCTALEKVIIPDSITSISDSCFSGCSSLSEVKIPDTVTSIGFRAFAECTSLEYIDLPSDLKYVSRYLFYKCSSLKQITIPDRVSSIGWHAFDGCFKLNSVKLNENLKCIESSAFYNCYDLKSIYIPSANTYFESSSSFGYCDDLVTGEEYQKIEDFKLYCLKGSKAEENAIKYGTKYESINIIIEERCAYVGEPIVPMVKITIGDNFLSENSDYTIECSNNDKIGTADIKISFKNEYTFLPEIEKTYEICYGLSECIIVLDKDVYQYHEILPEIQVKHNGKLLNCGVDYEIEYIIGNESWIKSNESTSKYIWDKGNGIATIKGIGSYVGECDLEFIITKFDMANAKLMTPWISQGNGSYSSSFDMKHFEYDGTAKTQSGYRVCDNNDTISSDNYEVSYRDNISAGTATMVITGKGDYYTGTLEKKFETYHNHNYETVVTTATTSSNGISKQACSTCGDVKFSKTIYKISSVSISTTAYTYNGEKKTPSVTVKDSKGNKLVKDEDYTVTYSSSTRKSIGSYSVKVTFKGDYSGSKTLYFTIGPKNPTSVSAKLYGYDDVKVSWNKVSGASGYKVYYKKSTSSTWSSKTTTGTSVKLADLSDGVKYDIKVVTYKTVNGNKCYNAGKTTSIYTLKKVAGVKVAKSGSKVIVSWTNIFGETGYQISQSTSKSGTNVVATYKTTSGKSKTISATKGKTFYYKVRAYKEIDGKKIYGPWSTVVKYKR